MRLMYIERSKFISNEIMWDHRQEHKNRKNREWGMAKWR